MEWNKGLDNKTYNIMFPLVFAMLLLDLEISYSFSCEEYVKLLHVNMFNFNSVWLMYFFTVEKEHAVTILFGTTCEKNVYVSNLVHGKSYLINQLTFNIHVSKVLITFI